MMVMTIMVTKMFESDNEYACEIAYKWRRRGDERGLFAYFLLHLCLLCDLSSVVK